MTKYYEKLEVYETKMKIRDEMIKKMKKKKIKFDPNTFEFETKTK